MRNKPASDVTGLERHRASTASLHSALRRHWPEYLIELWALGSFMVAVSLLVTLFEAPISPVYRFIPVSSVRLTLLAFAVGMTLSRLIQTRWGQRSGAHMNPAITLAFLYLNKIHPWDALYYVIAQLIGGSLGVALVAASIGSAFRDPPVRYALTTPGPTGVLAALIAETAISFLLRETILICITSSRGTRFTAIAVGCLVALVILAEAPISGASMNPARTLASALPGMMWQHVWIYLIGPLAGMLFAAWIHRTFERDSQNGCAKLLHPDDIRCIHCGHMCE